MYSGKSGRSNLHLIGVRKKKKSGGGDVFLRKSKLKDERELFKHEKQNCKERPSSG